MPGAAISEMDAKLAKSDKSCDTRRKMSIHHSPPILPTVSRAFLQDWLTTLSNQCPPQRLSEILRQAGVSFTGTPRSRVTHDQFVRLYKLVVDETQDEMMGLWSRPIRPGALKHLCTSVRGASSLSAALFRFTSFWNLLLDDYQLTLESDGDLLRVELLPRGTPTPQRFGQVLLLKLTHGIASWLVGRELPLHDVGFIFPRPEFAQDYPILFPAPVRFDQPFSSITFAGVQAEMPVSRSDSEMQDFLHRAPRDWIFTSLREHTLSLQIRELLLQAEQLDYRLNDAAQALNLTPRTLMRRLDAEGTSFQGIKDDLRRDIAIRDLTHGNKSIEAISQDIGFASAANFHRAFKRWTDATPGTYRQKMP